MDCLDADGVLRGEAWPDAQSSAERGEGSMSTDIKLVRSIPRLHDTSSTETKMGPRLQCLDQYVECRMGTDSETSGFTGTENVANVVI